MMKIFKNRISFSLIILIIFLFLPKSSLANFSDSEKSIENKISAGSLNLELDDYNSFSIENLISGDEVLFSKTIKNVGSLDFKYKIYFKIKKSENNVCENLNLKVDKNNDNFFQGSVTDFSEQFILTKNSEDIFNFSIELSDNMSSSLENSNCIFDLKFIAWQTNFSSENQGWSDTEIVENNFIKTGDWSIENLTEIKVLNNLNENLGCESYVNDRNITVDWADSLADNFDHYEFRIIDESVKAFPTESFYLENIPDQDGYYKYSVRVVGKNGVTSEWTDWCGVTLDRLSPVISDINLVEKGKTPDEKNVVNTISWKTDEETTTNIIWDTVSHSSETGYTFSFPDDEDLTADRLTHFLEFNQAIESEFDYYFRIVAVDKAGNISYSEEHHFQLISEPIPVVSNGDVVLNEFLPNPEGNESWLIMPDGEWIELYNTTDEDIDLTDFYFEDAGGKRMYISTENSDNDGDTDDSGETIIPKNGYLVVYDIDKTPGTFSLNNEDLGGDTINFFNKDGSLLDSFIYVETISGKTYARFPDGGVWVDPKPTPGKKNKFTDEELKHYQNFVINDCFDDKNKLIKNAEQQLCKPIFVEYIGLIKNINSDKLKTEFIQNDSKEVEKNENVDLENK